MHSKKQVGHSKRFRYSDRYFNGSYISYENLKLTMLHIEGWAQDYGNSNIFLQPLFRGNLDPFVNNANLGAIAHTSNGT